MLLSTSKVSTDMEVDVSPSEPSTARFRKFVPDTQPIVQLQISESKSREQDKRRWSVSVFGLTFVLCASADSRELKNPLYSLDLGEYMRSTYFARFPLWSRLALGHRLQKSNATAEAGVRIFKQEENTLRKGTRLLRLDELVATRIPIRAKQARLLVTCAKRNIKRLRQEAQQNDAATAEASSELLEKDSWDKPRKATVTLSENQKLLVARFVAVAKWRKQTSLASRPVSLRTFSQEIYAASSDVLSEPCTLSRGKLSQFQNSGYWPKQYSKVTAIERWVAMQEADRARADAGTKKSCIASSSVYRRS